MPPGHPRGYPVSRDQDTGRRATRASSWGCFPQSRHNHTPHHGGQGDRRRSQSQPQHSKINVKADPFLTKKGDYAMQAPSDRFGNVKGKRPDPSGKPRALQVTVCYVTNLKETGWMGMLGAARPSKPHVLTQLCDYGGKPTRQSFRAVSRPDKAVPPDILEQARHALPTNFDHSGVFTDIAPQGGQSLLFSVQEAGFMGKTDFCKPMKLPLSRALLMELDSMRHGWGSQPVSQNIDKFLPERSGYDTAGANHTEVGMKVQLVEVKYAGMDFTARINDGGMPQELTSLGNLFQPARDGDMELEIPVPVETLKYYDIKAGTTLFIAPEVNGRREMARILKTVTRGGVKGRQFLRLDSRLRHNHGIGTTVAIRRKKSYSVAGLCNCESCFQHCKICFSECWQDGRMCCCTAFWSCCICCIETRRLFEMCCNWCLGRNSLRDLRRQCARRCKLPYDPAVADDDGKDTACCCVPLRTAVFLLSLLTFILALLDFMFPHQVEGLDVKSHVVSGVIELSGLFFGPLGAIGACQLQVNLLNMYNFFQIGRLIAKLYTLYNDAPLLADCDLWRTNINAAIQKYGWNASLYEIAMNNACTKSQVTFVLWNIFIVGLYMYLISLTRRLIWDCESTPKYLLSMPRETPSGAFMTYNRTQGKSHPPYGAIDGSSHFQEERRRPGLVGDPVGLYQPLPYNRSLAKPIKPGERHFNY